jgi:hypothetical protein
MELNQPQVQLIFNVIAITAITSLAVMCALLKRDKDNLAAEINRRSHGSLNQSEAPAALPQPTPRVSVPPSTQQDIRQFVAHRAQVWMAPSMASRLTQS